jgi:hypothetical protein
MNNTILSASSPKMYTYNLRGQKITITIKNNPFNFQPQTLFSLALRKNKKRGFLFVSNVLGKHVPVNPFISLLAGAALAVQYLKKIFQIDHVDTEAIIQALQNKQDPQAVYEKVSNRSPILLRDQTLFISFAETATALGQAAFSLFDNAYYLHTTREHLPLLTSELSFQEEHSHAVNHRCYPLDPELLKTPKTIVLVDDELTTGKTVLNIIQEIHRKFPKTEYVVLSLLDWRTAKNRANFSELEQRLSIKIHTISLLAGEIAIHEELAKKQIDHIDCVKPVNTISGSRPKSFPMIEIFPTDKSYENVEVVTVYSEDSSGYQNHAPYLKLTGRFGWSSYDQFEILPLAKKIGEKLKSDRKGKVTLCLGTGEYMYFPMLIAAYMGKGVCYHSTTRSPIYPFSTPQYGIQNGFAFSCPDDVNITNYVYNVPLRHYDETYLFLERNISSERLTPLFSAFQEMGMPRLVLVIGSTQKA